jgi:hypothetical protein
MMGKADPILAACSDMCCRQKTTQRRVAFCQMRLAANRLQAGISISDVYGKPSGGQVASMPPRWSTTSAATAAAAAASAALARSRRRHVDFWQLFGIILLQGQCMADVLFDFRLMESVVLTGKADRYPGGTQSRGASDPMHIILGALRQIVIDHVRHRWYVQASGRDIGAHQHCNFAGTEPGQQFLPPLLRHIAGQQGG